MNTIPKSSKNRPTSSQQSKPANLQKSDWNPDPKTGTESLSPEQGRTEQSADTNTTTDTKKLVSSISMPFEHLRRDMYAVSQRTNGMGNIFWKLSIDLATHVAKIEFCGITQQKDVTMTSTGKGILREEEGTERDISIAKLRMLYQKTSHYRLSD